MTMIKITSELEQRLRAFIKTPDNFLDSLGLVNAFHHEKVIASIKPYALSLDGKQVVPVFSNEADFHDFQAVQESSHDETWGLRSVLDVLRESISHNLAGMVFNLKKSGDTSNSTFFPNQEMLTFVNSFTAILNDLLGEENQKADTLHKYYLMPAFVFEATDDQAEMRLFPSISNPDGESYIPVFSNLASFAKWYNNEQFGGRFRKENGRMLTWKLETIVAPLQGENELDKTQGVVINPFDDDMTLLGFDELTAE